MITRVFGYLRVSGTGQLDGDGFDRQRETIQKYCESKGWVVSRWFEEKAVSGTVEAMDRPAFAEMLKTTGELVTRIVVERADRLARDLMVSELLIAEARKWKIQVFEAAADLELTNSDDPTRVLIRQIMAALAEWEKNTTVKKLRVARMRIRAEGKRCEGRKPIEHTPAGKETCWIIIQCREVRKWGFTQISRYLNSQRIPSASGIEWSRNLVYDIYTRTKNLSSVRNFYSDNNDRTAPGGLPSSQVLSGLPGYLSQL